jgi:Matrixin
VLSRALRIVLSTLGIGLLALVPAVSVRAYVLTGSKWPQPSGLGTPVTLTYSFQNMFDGGLLMPNGQPLPKELIRGSIEEALGLWASVAPLNFVEVNDDGLDYQNGASQFGQIRFRHAQYDGAEPTLGGPKSKAYAYYPSAGFPNAGDVTFDQDDRWQEVGAFRQPDVLGAAIHEIGHSLGLDHSLVELSGQFWVYQENNGQGQLIDVMQPKGGANMYWIFTRYSGLGTGMLFPDDIAGIRAIYGTGHGNVASLVPEPATALLAFAALLGARWPRRRVSWH